MDSTRRYHWDRRLSTMWLVLLSLAATLTLSAQETTLFQYRGFAYDDSTVRQSPKIEAIRTVMAKQIDIVYAVGLSQETRAFFQKVPIKIVAQDAALNGGPAAYSFETKAIPMFLNVIKFPSRPILLHELLHAYHHQCLPNGKGNADIHKLYELAKVSRVFEKKSHMMSNEQEFFACAAATYLYGVTAQEPFKREKLQADAELFGYLKKMFGSEAGTYVGSLHKREGKQVSPTH